MVGWLVHTLTLVPTSQSEGSTCCYVPGTWSSTRFPILLLLLLLLNHFSGLPFPSPMHESESEAAQSCPTLSNLMDCSLPDTSVHGIFQATAYTSCSISSQVLTQHIPWAPEAGKQAHPLMWNIPQTNGQSLCVCVCICVLLGGRAAGVGMGWGWVCSQGGLPGGGSPESTAKEGGVRGYC